MEAYTWNAIFLPKGTPEPIVKKLADAASQAIDTPAVKEKLAALGAMVVAPDRRSPQYLDKFVREEIAKWREPILKSGAQN
jgi:tripartite-type tricarboxylate transporter receptor subunit TctC